MHCKGTHLNAKGVGSGEIICSSPYYLLPKLFSDFSISKLSPLSRHRSFHSRFPCRFSQRVYSTKFDVIEERGHKGEK